jgi:hypothetical protein
MRKRERGWCLDLLALVVLVVLLPSTAWCIPYLGVSCVDHNNSRIGAITHNSSYGNSSNNNSSSSSSSTMPLFHCCSKLPLGHHSRFLLATFHASIVGRWATFFENVVSPSKATRCELRHPWSISKGAIRRVLHHGRAMPTTPPCRIFPWEKNC